jgi:DNA processing protein
MSQYSEQTYWIALANLPRWGSERLNKLIIRIHQNSITPADFFESGEDEWKSNYDLSENEITDLVNARKNFVNNSFLAENLLSQGFEIIPITSKDYSATLKNNLKTKLSPPLLYIKGNKQILNEDSIAIVGSRDASEISLKFTDNIARIASAEFRVIVSGFAKGVDKQALDSALLYKGHSIIVLPQGILTFASGINKYYKHIVDGDALVLSVFHPLLPWSAGLAMARNPVIYGLAKNIYVAQSSESGGTWAGVKVGLKMGRKIYIRQPEPNEKNANLELIRLGAVPVDFNGMEINPEKKSSDDSIKSSNVKETSTEELIEILRNTGHPLTSKEISEKLNNIISPRKVTILLKNHPGITKSNKQPLKYSLIKKEGMLF